MKAITNDSEKTQKNQTSTYIIISLASQSHEFGSDQNSRKSHNNIHD